MAMISGTNTSGNYVPCGGLRASPTAIVSGVGYLKKRKRRGKMLSNIGSATESPSILARYPSASRQHLWQARGARHRRSPTPLVPARNKNMVDQILIDFQNTAGSRDLPQINLFIIFLAGGSQDVPHISICLYSSSRR